MATNNHFTIYNSKNNCFVRIVTEKPDDDVMELILGGEKARMVMSAGIMYFRRNQLGLPINYAAVSIMEGEGSDDLICGNVIIIARNGLQTVM